MSDFHGVAKKTKLSETQRFLNIVSQLRQKCPWDKKQTHRSLAKYLLEEAYEAVEAIESGNPTQLREELGDVLLQIALHSELASEKKDFTFDDVAKVIADKMVRRHPHVFGDTAYTAKGHKKLWEELKKKEKPKAKGTLDGVSTAIPALQRAEKLGKISATVEFDWNSAVQVLEKLDEEIGELRRVIRRKGARREQEEEIGDILFTVAQLSRHLGVDSETSLRKANQKFTLRFTAMELALANSGRRLDELSFKEKESAWQKAKKSTRRAKVGTKRYR